MVPQIDNASSNREELLEIKRYVLFSVIQPILILKYSTRFAKIERKPRLYSGLCIYWLCRATAKASQEGIAGLVFRLIPFSHNIPGGIEQKCPHLRRTVSDVMCGR
jgi:hypothetical protein